MLHDTGTLGAEPISTPMDYTLKSSKGSGTTLANISGYRCLIGKLLYLSHTSLDIAFVINRLSQFLDSPSNVHHQAASHILRYLKDAPATDLFFSASPDLKLYGYSDSN